MDPLGEAKVRPPWRQPNPGHADPDAIVPVPGIKMPSPGDIKSREVSMVSTPHPAVPLLATTPAARRRLVGER